MFLLFVVFAAIIPAETDRLVVVRAAGWDAAEGELVRYQRDDKGWRQVGRAVRVSLGGKGLAWGSGVVALEDPEPQKREGDGKTPAGLFALGEAFGYGERPEGVELAWRRVGPGDVCVDDPASRHYNRLVDGAAVARDWRSAEPMRRGDDLYRFGAVIAHNPAARPGAGSCIFFHVARRRGAPTVGCVAMAESELVALLRWMKPGRTLVAILPDEAMRGAAGAWGLPGGIRK